MANKKRDSMIECLNAMEDSLTLLSSKRDIWQNNIIYWLCRSVWLLLEKAVKDGDKR